MSRRSIRLTTALLCLLASVTLGLHPASPAGAIDQSKGTPGFCPTSQGVTVVIDFQALGGETIVRCDPQTTKGTGLDALLNAGIQVDGVQRWGLAFICRIENRPSAVENVAIKGQGNYREACINTPPAAAYWSYWHAGNDCAWEYSQWGVKNRNFVQGGFEGWSFSLNATADTNPQPRIAAVRPGTEGGPCTAPDEPGPTSDDPLATQPGVGSNTAAPTTSNSAAGANSGTSTDTTRTGGTGGGGSAGAHPNTSGSTGGRGAAPASGATPTSESSEGALPPPRPRDPALAMAPADPQDNVAFTGGQGAPDVRDVLKKQAHASSIAPWVTSIGLVVLVILTVGLERRRRRLREGG